MGAATQEPRWFTETDADHSQSYIDRMRALAAEGTDLGGEARLIDAMVERGSRILDAGCGPGRVGAVLHACGHEVVGVDVDPELIAAAIADVELELGCELTHRRPSEDIRVFTWFRCIGS